MDLKTISTASPVFFSQTALEEVKRLYTQQANDQFLRVGVKGGGCSGMSYVLEFDTMREKDQQYLVEDVPIVVNSAHLIYLKNIEIDWSSGLNSRGFTFKNPNASSTCGCGTSFSV